jgi:hypothetical protein
MTSRNALFYVLLLSCCLIETAGADYTIIAPHGARMRYTPNGYTATNMNLGQVAPGGFGYGSKVDVVETDTIDGQTWSKLSNGYWVNSHLLRDSSGKMPTLTQAGGPSTAADAPSKPVAESPSTRSVASKAADKDPAKDVSKSDTKKTAKSDNKKDDKKDAAPDDLKNINQCISRLDHLSDKQKQVVTAMQKYAKGDVSSSSWRSSTHAGRNFSFTQNQGVLEVNITGLTQQDYAKLSSSTGYPPNVIQSAFEGCKADLGSCAAKFQVRRLCLKNGQFTADLFGTGVGVAGKTGQLALAPQSQGSGFKAHGQIAGVGLNDSFIQTSR